MHVRMVDMTECSTIFLPSIGIANLDIFYGRITL